MAYISSHYGFPWVQWLHMGGSSQLQMMECCKFFVVLVSLYMKHVIKVLEPTSACISSVNLLLCQNTIQVSTNPWIIWYVVSILFKTCVEVRERCVSQWEVIYCIVHTLIHVVPHPTLIDVWRDRHHILKHKKWGVPR